MPTPMSSTIGSAGLATGLVVMWSSGFIGAELGTRDATADTLLMWRFIAAAALLGGGWLLLRRRRLPVRAVVEQSVIGILSQGCYVGPIVWAVGLGVPSGTSALIAALQPLAAGALAGPLLGERVGRRQWVGLGVGLAGVALVVRDDLSGATAPAWAYVLPFTGMVALLAASFLERRVTVPLATADALPVHCMTSALLFTAVAGAAGHAAAPTAGSFWVAVGWVVVLSTVGGYGFYWLSLRRNGVTRTSALIYLTPPTTAVWAYAMFGDGLGATALVGMVICVAGVAAATLGTSAPAGHGTEAIPRTPEPTPTTAATTSPTPTPTSPPTSATPATPATRGRRTTNARCAAGS
ncbi:DMT family transporter [Streptomyces zagrosensis]|uniref:Drug/metabolite transporter (DMT)-like permease n=1 Tax=Streptomyces zagrosensis TaxID=1042984 RepID=A0A7W9UXF7_9ACTN|nr:DMT family transporter [Streptomyces zagrosensis]MBB5933659.1 drug/metabolite transporter (DMT)-like permease [Streptomyces zagrosensis]